MGGELKLGTMCPIFAEMRPTTSPQPLPDLNEEVDEIHTANSLTWKQGNEHATVPQHSINSDKFGSGSGRTDAAQELQDKSVGTGKIYLIQAAKLSPV